MITKTLLESRHHFTQKNSTNNQKVVQACWVCLELRSEWPWSHVDKAKWVWKVVRKQWFENLTIKTAINADIFYSSEKKSYFFFGNWITFFIDEIFKRSKYVAKIVLAKTTNIFKKSTSIEWIQISVNSSLFNIAIIFHDFQKMPSLDILP